MSFVNDYKQVINYFSHFKVLIKAYACKVKSLKSTNNKNCFRAYCSDG